MRACGRAACRPRHGEALGTYYVRVRSERPRRGGHAGDQSPVSSDNAGHDHGWAASARRKFPDRKAFQPGQRLIVGIGRRDRQQRRRVHHRGCDRGHDDAADRGPLSDKLRRPARRCVPIGPPASTSCRSGCVKWTSIPVPRCGTPTSATRPTGSRSSACRRIRSAGRDRRSGRCLERLRRRPEPVRSVDHRPRRTQRRRVPGHRGATTWIGTGSRWITKSFKPSAASTTGPRPSRRPSTWITRTACRVRTRRCPCSTRGGGCCTSAASRTWRTTSRNRSLGKGRISTTCRGARSAGWIPSSGPLIWPKARGKTYYVAVTSNRQMPKPSGALHVPTSRQPKAIRLEPVTSVNADGGRPYRVPGLHDSDGLTSGRAGATGGAVQHLQRNQTGDARRPFNLGDVPCSSAPAAGILCIPPTHCTAAGTSRWWTATWRRGTTDLVRDLVMRTDGRMYGYRRLNNDATTWGRW